MPVDAEQGRILQAHLQGKNLVCPLCTNRTWHLVEVLSLPTESAAMLTHPKLNQVLSPETAGKIFGTEDQPAFVAPTTLVGGKETGRRLPVAIAACSNCSYLVQFAWLPIVRKTLRG